MKVNDFLIRSLWIIYILVTLAIPLGFPDNLSRLVNYSTIVISICLVCISIFQSKINKNILFLFIVIVTLSFVAVINKIGGYDLNYFVKYFDFLCVLFSYLWGLLLKINDKTKQFILYSNLILGIVFVILSIIKPYNLYSQLTLGMSNPNTTGILIYYNLIFLLLLLFIKKSKILSLLLIILCIYEGFLLFMTDSRTAIISIALIFLYVIFGKRILLTRWLIGLCLIWPILFFVIYIFLYLTSIVPIDFMLLNKPFFTQREIMWIEVYNSIKHNLWGGHYSLFYNEMLHNSHFDLLTKYGLPTMIFILIYIYKVLTSLLKKSNSTIFGRLALIAILGAFIQGSSESSVLDGGLNAYICLGSFMLLINNADISSICDKNKKRK